MTDKETPLVIDFAERAKARKDSQEAQKGEENQTSKTEEAFTADMALEEAKGKFKSVLIIGLKENDDASTYMSDDITVQTCIYLCELTKANTMIGAMFNPNMRP